MVDSICNIEHNNRIIVRMSVNPEKIINQVEFGTSKLKGRIESINKLKAAGYKLGILIAPVIMIDNWQEEEVEENICIKTIYEKKENYFLEKN